jgi:hypothetical protein
VLCTCNVLPDLLPSESQLRKSDVHFLQGPQPAQRPCVQLPELYIVPCLEHIHGSTCRIDDLVASLLALLKRSCIIGEEVMVQVYGRGLQPSVVQCLKPGAL